MPESEIFSPWREAYLLQSVAGVWNISIVAGVWNISFNQWRESKTYILISVGNILYSISGGCLERFFKSEVGIGNFSFLVKLANFFYSDVLIVDKKDYLLFLKFFGSSYEFLNC